MTRPRELTHPKHIPAFALVAGFCLLLLYLPVIVIMAYSFNNAASLGASFTGASLRWYRQVLHDPLFYSSTWNSLVIATSATAIATVLATMAALGTTRRRPWRGQNTAYVAIVTPLLTPEIVMAVALLACFSALSRWTGIQFGLFKLVLAHAGFCIPFAYLPLRGRLERMDLSMEHAAADLYARPWRVFRYVTFPQLVPGIASGAALSFIVSFDDFTISQFLAGPGEMTLPMYIWSTIRRALDPSLNAMCTVILVVSVVLIATSFVLSSKSEK